MSVAYSELWNLIQNHVSKVHGVQYTSLVRNNADMMIIHRTAQLFILEVFLHQHREQYGASVFPLKGRSALHHVILLKYKWPLPTIRNLSLSDSLFVIQDELTLDNLPESAQKFLSNQILLVTQIEFEHLHDDEWDPALGEIFLRTHKP
ncbi:ECs1072 family phage-associated protein [Klebsiella sp. WOUb02]|uniref:ECs1072 family phage-associated protein n=1 Tax=Klebsiella sp. WOUb02 TaxID=3161071 RepID=UPI003CEE0F5A